MPRPTFFPFLPLLLLTGAVASAADLSVSVSIDAASRTAISPYVYGSNQELPGVTPTARRQGGNRMTAYNWETNASNAGSDYFHHSDNYLPWIMGIPDADASRPAVVITRFHEQARADGSIYSIATLPMAGYVARDKAGEVTPAQSAPSNRWTAVRNEKGSAFTTTPDTSDAYVYTDELLNLLLTRLGNAAGTGINGYSLDNEPGLWSSTHARVHPTPVRAAELIERSVDLARTVKRMDNAAEVFGPVLYGVNAYLSLQDAPDWAAERAKGPYTWFIDYYLDQMKKAASPGRLLDVLDVHLYSEHRGGGERVSDSTNYNNRETNRARMQAPRSLWDRTFVENSWIGQYYAWTMPFIPRLRQSIDQFYPGTKLAFTEYNFGGESHISGGLAQAEALGAFGAHGVHLATFWQLHDDVSYAAAAFRLYLDYDGQGGRFGDVSLRTTTSDVANVGAYASLQSSDGRFHLVLINRNDTDAANISVSLANAPAFTRGRAWGFDARQSALSERSAPTVNGQTVTYRVPALTAVHLVLETSVPSGVPVITQAPASLSVFPGGSAQFSVVATGTAPLAYQWLKNGAVIPGATASSYTIAAVNPDDAGTYAVTVSNAQGSVTTTPAVLSIGSAGDRPRLVNVSTRALVGAGERVLIAGFIIAGPGEKKVLLRGIGPSLAPYIPTGFLANPQIRLVNQWDVTLGTNDDWSQAPNAAEIQAAMEAKGVPLAPGSKDAALLVSLPPGGYTLLVSGVGNTTGTALAEVFDADPAAPSRLTNLSGRGYVGTGNDVLIAGFILDGPGTRRVLVRAGGPALVAMGGLAEPLSDPTLVLTDLNGVRFGENDNWSAGGRGPEIRALDAEAGAYDFADGSRDAVLMSPRPAGGFTGLVRGVGSATGVALVEVFELP